jgi:hypothetical protein
LSWIVQNNRFLLLPQDRPMNLASRILGLAIKALPGAWEARYGKRPLLAETFILNSAVGRHIEMLSAVFGGAFACIFFNCGAVRLSHASTR